MSGFRWQCSVLVLGMEPQDGVPDGWVPSGDEQGAWVPVQASGIGEPPKVMVLWRRLLKKSATKKAAPTAREGVPTWMKPERGVDALELVGMVARCLEQITQRPTQNMERRATDGKQVLALWRSLGRPSTSEFADDMELVARAARECPDPLFAHDIRAEGWSEGRDRSHDVSTLCVQRRWGDRLRAAQEWSRHAEERADQLPLVEYDRDSLPRFGN